jgi:hypothetical protein
MPGTPPRSRLREASRGILLLTGLGVMTVAAGLVIAAATVALIG